MERTSYRAAVLIVAALTFSLGSAPSQATQPCRVDAAYRGPEQRTAPASVWRDTRGNAITGELPADIRERLDATVDRLLTRVPGVSVAVAIPGVGRWDTQRGRAQTTPPRDIRDDETFHAASTTKTLTAAVIHQLAAEGKLSLDDPVARWMADVPNAAQTSIDDLLRHTSGLVSFNALPGFDGATHVAPAAALALGLGRPSQFCPGTNWAYTNTGYTLLGLIIERIEGRPLAAVFTDRLFTPLGMTRSTLRQPGVPWPVVSGHASGVPARGDGHYTTAWAAGGLATTARDLVTFWHAFLGGSVMKDSAVREMFTDMSPMSPDRRMFYGRGVQLYDIPDGPGLMLGHSGGIVGFTSVVAYLPTDNVYVAAIVNDKDVPAEAVLWALVQAARTAGIRRAGSECCEPRSTLWSEAMRASLQHERTERRILAAAPRSAFGTSRQKPASEPRQPALP
jgi:D-alanyl-D-alanine carboxypeptidase